MKPTKAEIAAYIFETLKAVDDGYNDLAEFICEQTSKRQPSRICLSSVAKHAFPNLTKRELNNRIQRNNPTFAHLLESVEQKARGLGLLKSPKSTARQRRYEAWSDEALIKFAGDYLGMGDMSYRNDTLRREINNRELRENVLKYYVHLNPDIQRYVGIGGKIYNSVPELLTGNYLALINEPFDTQVASVARGKVKNLSIDFSLPNRCIHIEIAQNDQTQARSSRRKEYADNKDTKTYKYKNLEEWPVIWIVSDMRVEKFYNLLIHEITNIVGHHNPPHLDEIMFHEREDWQYMLEMPAQDLATFIIEKRDGLKKFYNNHSAEHKYVMQREDYKEVYRIARNMAYRRSSERRAKTVRQAKNMQYAYLFEGAVNEIARKLDAKFGPFSQIYGAVKRITIEKGPEFREQLKAEMLRIRKNRN